jgi:hypothetical protein
VAGERGKGKRAYKLFGGARHHHVNIEGVLLQEANQFGGFVCRDAAGDAERDFEGMRATHGFSWKIPESEIAESVCVLKGSGFTVFETMPTE